MTDEQLDLILRQARRAIARGVPWESVSDVISLADEVRRLRQRVEQLEQMATVTGICPGCGGTDCLREAAWCVHCEECFP